MNIKKYYSIPFSGEPLKILNWIFIAIGLSLVSIGTICSVFAETIDPGNTTYIDCNNTNETFGVTCNECPDCNLTCPDYGVCRINTSIYPGETYNYTEGVCELDIQCNATKQHIGLVYYPGIIEIKKTDDNITVDIDIRDYQNAPYQRNTYPSYYKDILNIQFPFNFSCPADLTTEVNLETCSKYLPQIWNRTDPIMATFSYAQSKCTDELTRCYGNIIGQENRADNYERLYHEENKKTLELTSQIEDMDYELNSDYGRCSNQTKSEQVKFVKYQQSTVSGWWFWGFVVLFLVNAAYIGWQLFGQGGF